MPLTRVIFEAAISVSASSVWPFHAHLLFSSLDFQLSAAAGRTFSSMEPDLRRHNFVGV